MKKYPFIAILGIALFSNAHSADVDTEESPHQVTANVAYTTNYVYRGISQTSEDPAIQGGLDYSYTGAGAMDFYFGTWGSSLDFADGSTSMEIDWYGGLTGAFTSGSLWDIGGLYYQYPSTNADAVGDFDFFEFYGNLEHSFAGTGGFAPSLTTGVAYSPDFYGENGNSLYVYGNLSVGLPQNLNLSFTYGYQDLSGDKTNPEGFDYAHYVAGISTSWHRLNFDLSYYDTPDLEVCGGKELCESLVLTVSTEF